MIDYVMIKKKRNNQKKKKKNLLEGSRNSSSTQIEQPQTGITVSGFLVVVSENTLTDEKREGLVDQSLLDIALWEGEGR